jgi:ABC-type transport system involved in cytochrome bd biosynthesis fused ATPase/permease subunit
VWNGIDDDFLMLFFWVQVSLDRIWNFLQEEELPKDAVIHVPKEQSGGVAIEIKGGEFSWNLKFDNEQERQQQLLHQNTLSNINLQVKSGSCVAICGTVGSGKSSLLSCILGEIPKLAGTVKVSGATAYVTQSATFVTWLLLLMFQKKVVKTLMKQVVAEGC